MKQPIFPGRKDKIVMTAIDIISDFGIQGLSTKELAKRQDITESLLYRYFRSKDDIIIAVLEFYAEFDQSITYTLLHSDLDCKSRILEFTRMYMEYYENYPAITAILHSSHQLMIDDHSGTLIKDILNNRSELMMTLIAEGQTKGEITDHFTPQQLTDMILGLTRNLTLTWRMEGFSFSLKERALGTVEKIMALCDGNKAKD